MARIPDDIINDVRAKADIVSIIGQYLPLTKKGKNYVGLCPFHDDHNPSMSISSEKQIYKCFVCHAGGNVFSFVSDYEKISFVDAVIKVANEVNIDLSEYKSETKVVDQKFKLHYEVLDQANQFLKYQLQASDGLAIKEYLNQRGINKELIDTFEIGYNPPNQVLSAFLQAKHYNLATMVDVNVVNNYDGQVFDVFANRITFPIRNYYGQLIGFSGRALDNNQAKYINTATTDLYIKSQILYNVHQVREAVKKAGYVIVVEGVMDVIAYYKAGVLGVVSPLGTAFTKSQIETIRKLSQHVVLSFDGDDAGLSAIQQAIDLLLPYKLTVEVITFDKDEDPDDVIERAGKEALLDLVEKRIHWLEFSLKYYQSIYNLDNYNQKKTYVNKMLGYIKQLDDNLDKQHFSKLLAMISGFDEYELYNATLSTKRTKHDRIVNRAPQKDFMVPIYEKEILAQMILSKQAANLFQNELGYLSHELAQASAMLLISLYRSHDDYIEIADIISMAQAKGLDKFLMNLLEWPLFPKEINLKALNDAMFHVKLKVMEDKANNFKGLAAQSIDPKAKAKYINQMIETLQEIQQLKQKEGVYDKI